MKYSSIPAKPNSKLFLIFFENASAAQLSDDGQRDPPGILNLRRKMKVSSGNN